jgi:hypothetical protein
MELSSADSGADEAGVIDVTGGVFDHPTAFETNRTLTEHLRCP